jgi:hypothetical protein
VNGYCVLLGLSSSRSSGSLIYTETRGREAQEATDSSAQMSNDASFKELSPTNSRLLARLYNIYRHR